MFKLLFVFLFILSSSLASAITTKETANEYIVTVANHKFAINKSTSPSWGKQYSLIIDNNKNLRLSSYVGVDDEIFQPKGIGQLVPSKTKAKISVISKTSHTLTIKVEYAIAQVGKKNAPNYPKVKLIYYYSFASGIPGVAVNIRAKAINNSATIRALNSSFGANFTKYTTSNGTVVEYPNKSWSNIKSKYVIAEQKDIKIAVTSQTRNPSKGFTWIGKPSQWKRITIKDGEFVEFKGFIGFVKDQKDLTTLMDFFNSIVIPNKVNKEASSLDMVAKVVKVGPNNWPISWPKTMVTRQGAGWIRPDTTDTWGGNDNLSFTATVGFDSKYFYLLSVVKDSYFRQTNTGDKIWAGDCMQVAFDPLNEKTLTNNFILLGFTANIKPTLWCWHHPNKKYAAKDISSYCKIRTQRNKVGYTYEIAIPWKLLKPFSIDQGKMGFNIVMLDDDGVGPRHWMGITDGIAGGKDPSHYKSLYFANPEKVLLANMKETKLLLRLNSDTTVGEEPLTFSVAQMLPKNLNGAKLLVKAGSKVWQEKLKLGFNSFNYKLLPSELKPGNLTITASLIKDNQVLYKETKSTRVVTRKSIESLCKETEQAIKVVEKAIKKLEKHHKNSAYYTNRVALAKYFIKMVHLDNSREVLYRAPATRVKKQMIVITPEYRRWIYRRSFRNLNYCLTILNSSVKEIDEIIANKAPNLVVEPMVKAGKVEIKNGGFYLNGKEMFFLGPNTWQLHYTQLKDIADIGLNFFDVTGLSKSNTPTPITPIDEEYIHEKLDNKFNPNILLKSKELGLYFFARQFAGCSYVQNLNTPNHYLKTQQSNKEIWEFEAKQPHLVYLISHLESFVHEKNARRLEKNMAKYLEKKYTTIANVNKTLGTKYKKFTDFKERDRSNKAVNYEIFLFEKEANFNSLKESNILKRKFWQKPTTTHISTSHWTAWDTLQNCADFEALYEECDIAGYDAGVRLDSNNYAASWEAVMMLCDFSRSLYPEKVVTNNECHNFPINCPSDVNSQFIYTAQMSEMLHGRNAGVMWKWEKDYHDPWGSYAFTRADSFHYAGLAALDARRLANEIASFRKEQRQFGIFYSLPSFSDAMMYKKINELYQGTYFHGVAPGFITEKTLLENKFLHYKVILIPDTRRVSDKVFNELIKRAKNGVKVIRFGEKSLTLDEYGKVKPNRTKELAKLPLYKVAQPEEYFPLIGKIFAQNNIKGKYTILNKNGKKPWALEYRSTSDGKLLYVINWNKKSQEIVLPKGKWVELFSLKASKNTIKLAPLDIKLFQKQ